MAETPNYPELNECTYWGRGACAAAGCVARYNISNLCEGQFNDLSDDEIASRVDTIKSDARASGCPNY